MVEPIRVLQVFAQMNRGGAEIMIMNLYRNINRTKIQFDFVVHTEEKCAFDEEIEGLGGKIYRIPRYVGKNHFTYKRAWRDFFKNHPEYQIIHGHVRSTASIYLKIAQSAGLKTIAHSHSTSSGVGINGSIKNILQFPIRFIADYLFACSTEAGVWLFGKHANKKENFYIFKNGIDIDKFRFNEITREKTRADYGITNNFVIGHIGRFNHPKNHSFIIEVFREILSMNSVCRLLLVGDGELRQSIEEKAKEYKIEDKIIFAGTKSDVTELLCAMDLFVFPSLYEGLGIALIEAQASGLGCVVSERIPNEAVLSNSVHKISLLEPVQIWAQTIIEKLVETPKKRDLCYQIVEEKGYSVKGSVNWLTEFYKNIIYQ